MKFSQLPGITDGKLIRLAQDQEVTSLLTDSRKAQVAEGGALFFAITGLHHDGHDFVASLYHQGMRQFIVERPLSGDYPDANVIQVTSSLRALQQMVEGHRRLFKIPVIGITGSNGKTIVKEWLYQLLSPDYNVVKNPASYNSQLGVPLSVWQMDAHHTMGIFEAGISTTGEMEHLEILIRPSLGVFTNIGPAHDEGFNSTHEKIREKMKLFRRSEAVVYCRDHEKIHQVVREQNVNAYSWGTHPEAQVQITPQNNLYRVQAGDVTFTIQPPFSDAASIENCFHCVCMLLQLKVSPAEIAKRISGLRAIPMRLEVKEGINQCQIIDDTYNNDLAGLKISLDFLSHQKLKEKRSVILSDIHQSGLSDKDLVQRIASLLAAKNVNRVIGIGPVLCTWRDLLPPGSATYPSTADFLRHFDLNILQREVILVKGARAFAFEKIVSVLQRKVHGTVMEIDLGALVSNFNYFKSLLSPRTKMMVMVKAFAYGSGSGEIANLLQYHKADYLGVAYADEGIELRNNNITLPIMVMNPSEDGFEAMEQYRLEPEIYHFGILEKLAAFLQGRPCKIHIKIDTGMRRLGFEADEIERVGEYLYKHPNLGVASVFSHLAGADEQTHDAFSERQAKAFQQAAERLSQRLGYRPMCHLLNSSGILRFPQYQFEMVRLGIGLYGVDPTTGKSGALKPVATLKTVISQIKQIAPGESVGYGRQGKAVKPLTTATIAIGYADGYSRAFSQGVGKVLVNGRLAPVIGNVCMDMTMLDITGIEAAEGDEVIIFGRDLPIHQVARWANTIPYEILTSTSERVKRVFVAESI